MRTVDELDVHARAEQLFHDAFVQKKVHHSARVHAGGLVPTAPNAQRVVIGLVGGRPRGRSGAFAALPAVVGGRQSSAGFRQMCLDHLLGNVVQPV